MPKCDIHCWERYELRDDDGTLYFVGYECRWCHESGYELDLEEAMQMSDPFAPARGILVGLIISVAVWAVILSLLGLFR